MGLSIVNLGSRDRISDVHFTLQFWVVALAISVSLCNQDIDQQQHYAATSLMCPDYISEQASQ